MCRFHFSKRTNHERWCFEILQTSGSTCRGFGGLLKRGLKRGLQLIKPHARKALDTARKRAVKYAKEQGIPYLEREAKKRYPSLKRRLLK